MSGRTMTPSPRRLREARRRGDVALSRPLVGVASTAAGLAALAAAGPAVVREEAARIRMDLVAAVTGPGPAPLDAALSALLRVAGLGLPPMAAACAGALLVGMISTGGLWAPDALRVRLERIDPAAGMRRMLSPAGAGRSALATLSAVAALAMAGGVLLGSRPSLARVPGLRTGAAWRTASGVVEACVPPLFALLVASALVDLLVVRHRHRARLRMTRTEAERDHREDEGDPRLRAERRRLHASLGSAPSRAACVVVNPTRLAVALAHRRGDDEPPVVLGKASGSRAAALRREARRLGIPVVQDRALARSLFRLADVGEAIPEELYEATAAVLAHVHAMATRGSP